MKISFEVGLALLLPAGKMEILSKKGNFQVNANPYAWAWIYFK